MPSEDLIRYAAQAMDGSGMYRWQLADVLHVARVEAEEAGEPLSLAQVNDICLGFGHYRQEHQETLAARRAGQ